MEMAHTIFILGTDAQQCRELKEILQGRISENIVTVSAGSLPSVHESDTVIITSEEKNSGALYRDLLNKLEEQVHRAHFLGELVRLLSSNHDTEEIVDTVVRKSTDILGDTAFVVLANDNDQLSL